MKIQHTLLTGVFAIVAMSSCVNEEADFKFSNKDKGTMQLNVDILKATPKTKAAKEVDYFPVIVKDAEGKTVYSYETVAEVPAEVVMNVGNYVVESHTPGIIRQKMTEPYYLGQKEIEIIKGITTAVEVVCKMQNSVIKVNYDEEFRTVFTEWTITIDDGSETALTFDNTTENNTVYWYFGEKGVKELVVNFRGKTKDGSIIVARNVLTKDQADESYDDDQANFNGGDLINISFRPTESTEGQIAGITINADVTFTMSDKNVTIGVIDKPGFEGGGGDNPDPNPGTDPEPGDENSITLSLPENFSFSMANIPDQSKGDTYIAAEKGIKSLRVQIESTSEDMKSSLSDLADQYDVNFLAGAEVVDNQNVVSLFNSLGQTLEVPGKGDTEYTFPIGNFFTFLMILPGDHTFHLTVEDMEGHTKSGTLVITIIE